MMHKLSENIKDEIVRKLKFRRTLKSYVSIEDIVQEVNIAINKSVETFDPKKGSLESWITWQAFGIAKSKVVHRREFDKISDGWCENAQKSLDQERYEGDPTKACEFMCVIDSIKNLLSERDRVVLSMRFGLFDREPTTFREIGMYAYPNMKKKNWAPGGKRAVEIAIDHLRKKILT
jgi:RNA polymerase sigma factor (sigma-70 family)